MGLVGVLYKLSVIGCCFVQVAWDWLRSDPAVEQHAEPLMSHIRFALIGPSDLVNRVQAVEPMTRRPELRDMVFAALNYHVVPHAQPLWQSASTTPRACTERLVSVGGREIHPHPGLHDELIVFGEDIAAASTLGGRRSEITTLPNALSHMQVKCVGIFGYCWFFFPNLCLVCSLLSSVDLLLCCPLWRK